MTSETIHPSSDARATAIAVAASLVYHLPDVDTVEEARDRAQLIGEISSLILQGTERSTRSAGRNAAMK